MLDCAQQLIIGDRLRENTLRPESLRVELLGGVTVRGDDDDGHMRRTRDGTYGARDLGAVRVRKKEIEHDEIRALRERLLQRFTARRRVSYAIAETGQYPHECRALLGVVVNDQ